MIRSKVKCFISYCQRDVDRDSLDYLVHLLEENSNQEFEILIDVKLPIGGNIAEFMKQLSDVDAVIIVMSPAYKTKVIDREGGAYTEYKTILTRYEELQDEKREGKKTGEIKGYFDLIPILFSGNISNSVPRSHI